MSCTAWLSTRAENLGRYRGSFWAGTMHSCGVTSPAQYRHLYIVRLATCIWLPCRGSCCREVVTGTSHAATGSQQRQKAPATARRGAPKASFAIREPQPAGLSLKASLQQLRGTTNCSQANKGREDSGEDVILSNAGEEQQLQYSFLPSASQAAAQTPDQAPGITATEFLLHPCMSLLLSIPHRSFQPPSRSGSAGILAHSSTLHKLKLSKYWCRGSKRAVQGSWWHVSAAKLSGQCAETWKAPESWRPSAGQSHHLKHRSKPGLLWTSPYTAS